MTIDQSSSRQGPASLLLTENIFFCRFYFLEFIDGKKTYFGNKLDFNLKNILQRALGKSLVSRNTALEI